MQVDSCSFWQFAACIEGFNKANGAEEKIEAPTDEEFEDMLRRKMN
jgi:hypothetical protein